MQTDKTTLIPITSTLLGENPDFVDIVTEFVNGLPKRLSQMRECLHQAQYADLRRLAHQMKGSGGGYGYDIITDAARELEDAALKEQLTSCTHSLQQIEKIIERVTAGLP